MTLTLRSIRVVATASAMLASLALAPLASAQPAPAQSVTIDSFAFAPQEISVPTGATVAWVNAQSGVRHTATSLDGAFDSGILATNDTFTFTFAQAGDFGYQCEIHPSMQGTIHVLAEDASVAQAAPTTVIAPPPIPTPTTVAPAAVPAATPTASYGY
jgi:plastocyanin